MTSPLIKPVPMRDWTQERWISPHAVAEYLDVSKMTVYRMLDRDELEYIRAGRVIRITVSSFLRWLDQGGTDAGTDLTRRLLHLA